MLDLGQLIEDHIRRSLERGSKDRETFLRAWLEHTGVPPDEAEMVEVVEFQDRKVIRTVTVKRKQTETPK